jgi:hypothetical protein
MFLTKRLAAIEALKKRDHLPVGVLSSGRLPD